MEKRLKSEMTHGYLEALPEGRLHDASLLRRVDELIDPITGQWDVQLVHDTFWPEDANEILRIPIDDRMEDWPA